MIFWIIRKCQIIQQKYFHGKKVINFDIIHHECRWDKLSNSYKHYKTVKAKDLKNYPDKDKKETSGVFRNVKRDDLWVQRDLMVEYFKKNFQVFNCNFLFLLNV